ncbi:hypothetical protein ANO11243_025890 [Dothideomycetidae sp. 11243]|nr:hypothetical protein ANO11243_025890 [fungal sp. No.11243]
MDDLGEEDDLFGHDFADVPANTLQQLEHDAITLSQRPHQEFERLQSRKSSALRQNVKFSKTSAIDAAMDNPAPPPPSSSDYGYGEEDVFDLNDPSFTFGKDEPPTLAYRTAHSNNSRKTDAHDYSRPGVTIHDADGTSDLEQLANRIAELENEHARLHSVVDGLQTDIVTKDGAIANLRSRNQRTAKDYEEKIQSLQKLHGEESSRLKAEVRAARNDEDNVRISNRFLEHDLAEERERTKKLKATNKNQSAGSAATTSKTVASPALKKDQSFTFRDGFDDHEIVSSSPTKVRNGDRHGTPKAGQKRKRNAVISPAVNTENSPIPSLSPLKQHPSDLNLDQEIAALSLLSVRDEHIDTLKRTLLHRCADGQRTLEALCRYHFRDASETSLTTMILEALSKIPVDETTPTSVAVRSICLDLWEQCLIARLFGPLPLILELLESMLQIETSAVQVLLFERLLPLVAKTTVIVAEPRVVRASKVMKDGLSSQEELANSPEELDDLPVIRLFHRVATSAALSREQAIKFWHRAEFAFIMLMLNQAQPATHVCLMLEIVESSSLEDSYGARHYNVEVQARQETDLLERLTSLLYDVRPNSLNQDIRQPDSLLDLRLRVLHTLRVISVTEHGSHMLAHNKTAIGRLSRFACDQVTLLHSNAPLSLPEIGSDTTRETGMRGAKKPKIRHELIIATINLTIRIIHHLLQNHDIVLDDKLASIHGGKGKLVIALSRIAFSERSLLEQGLEDQVVDAANEILDLMLSPEDGEAIVQVMESTGGT